MTMDSAVRLTSNSQSEVTIAEGIEMTAKGEASVKLTTDVAIKGGTVLAQGTLASLSVSTSIEGDGDSVKFLASNGASELELTAASASLKGVKTDVGGKALVNIAGLNVKIN